MEAKFKNQLDTAPAVKDFLSWFQREYSKRKELNPQYSVRAFAKFLQIAPPSVSHLLSGKRTPSIKYAKGLMLKLGCTPLERSTILNSLTKSSREVDEIKEYELIAIDSFKFISEWYHYAILELISTKQFRLSLKWIASELEISKCEVKLAIERLERLSLIKIKGGKVVKMNNLVTNYEEGITSSAHKKLQRYVLERALSSLELVPPEEKDITSMTMAIDETRLDEAKTLIKNFRRSLCNLLEEGVQTRVYNLGIQLYPISKTSCKDIL